MTLSEFKAWFEGFTENMDGPPSVKQWKRIQKRVGEITSQPVSVHQYVTREIRPYWNPPVWCGTTLQVGSNAVQTVGSNNCDAMATSGYAELGKADAAYLAAI